MSQQATRTAEAVPPETVRCTSGHNNKKLHRPDEEDGENPACPENLHRSDEDFRSVPTVAYRPNWGLCRHPECFGGER